MKALIIDDERLARKELTNLLKDHHEVEIIGEAVNVDDAYQKIVTLDPDLLFLDIQMPGKTGFDLLEMLDSVPKVIFTTAYDEYALKAFEVNALDYLLKPIQPERLAESIKKLFKLEEEEPFQDLPLRERKLGANDQVFVKDGDKCWFVRLSEVRLFESDGNYIKVYFENFKPMIHKSLNALDERLDDRTFFRASRVEKIEPWFNGGLMVQLKGGGRIEVSRRMMSL
jgi:two-component system LytT family response regulator